MLVLFIWSCEPQLNSLAFWIWRRNWIGPSEALFLVSRWDYQSRYPHSPLLDWALWSSQPVLLTSVICTGEGMSPSGLVKSSWRDSYALVDGEKMETVADFIFLGSKVTVDCDCSLEIKGHFLLGRKAMTNLDHVLKSREITLLKKGPYRQSYGFSSGHVLMWELDHKEDWVPENWWSQTVVLEKILESPLERKEIKPVNPKGNQSWISLEGLMVKLKFQDFQRANSLEKTLMLEKIEGRRIGWQTMRCLDGITNSMDMS